MGQGAAGVEVIETDIGDRSALRFSLPSPGALP
jgi:hypothetical protein